MSFCSSMTRLRDIVLATVFPFACRVCDRLVSRFDNGIGCDGCWAELEVKQRTVKRACSRCGVTLPGVMDNRNEGRECHRCSRLSIVAARSIGPHLGVLRESVLWLKSHPQICNRLQRLIEVAWLELPEPWDFDAIVPVPLHPRREAGRSFNQAFLIGEVVSRASGCRLETAVLIRVRDTERHRLGMGDEERARSLRGAFAATAPRLIRGRRLLLVDDVLTTGSTADEASRTLLAAGAREVALLTISRAERFSQ